ncbi:MAG: hypothetical protein IPL33_20180 [Sphingobacteriales bacterium]|nr:hypothetical protein [Sphingobacteriales bacterium]
MHVLVAPLDWGLGHATRCIPIIRYLLHRRHRVYIAANGRALALLRREFPDLPYTEMAGYEISYPDGSAPSCGATWAMFWAMLCQTPRILYRIYNEYKQTQALVRRWNIDCIVSDNRYGCRSPRVRSIIVCHQIFIQLPPPFAAFMPCLAWLHRQFLGHFDQCWIPDFADAAQSLSGNLSHYRPLPPEKYRFIGILSRFAPLSDYRASLDDQRWSNSSAPHNIPMLNDGSNPANTNIAVDDFLARVRKTDKPLLLLLVSGVEPMRSTFERQLTTAVANYSGWVCLLRGIADSTQAPRYDSQYVWVADHLPADQLAPLLKVATHIVARAGYSTIMDLVALRQTALLIPTPGQTEQVYLSHYLAQQGRFATLAQSEIGDIGQWLSEKEQP